MQDMDLLQRLRQSRLPHVLTEPSAIESAMCLTDKNLIAAKFASQSKSPRHYGQRPCAVVLSITQLGIQASKHFERTKGS